MTPDERAAAVARGRAQRAAQGLPVHCQDEGIAAEVARLLVGASRPVRKAS
jgi:hypothetical protein